jgi:hypothetical protein
VDGRDPLSDQTLPRVSTEMSLHVLAYNLKRTIQIFGAKSLMESDDGVEIRRYQKNPTTTQSSKPNHKTSG